MVKFYGVVTPKATLFLNSKTELCDQLAMWGDTLYVS
jgi:hypothetical protein